MRGPDRNVHVGQQHLVSKVALRRLAALCRGACLWHLRYLSAVADSFPLHLGDRVALKAAFPFLCRRLGIGWGGRDLSQENRASKTAETRRTVVTQRAIWDTYLGQWGTASFLVRAIPSVKSRCPHATNPKMVFLSVATSHPTLLGNN